MVLPASPVRAWRRLPVRFSVISTAEQDLISTAGKRWLLPGARRGRGRGPRGRPPARRYGPRRSDRRGHAHGKAICGSPKPRYTTLLIIYLGVISLAHAGRLHEGADDRSYLVHPQRSPPIT